MTEIESANQSEGRGILSYDQFLTLYFPAFVFALGYSIATPAIPVFAKSFDTGFAVASLVIVMHALGGLIAAVPSGFLIDRIGRRPVLLLGPLLMALSSILTALAGSFMQLLAYRFIGGVAMEMWRQARLAMIADVAKQRQRGRQMTGMIGTEGAGRLIGPALGGVLAGWSIRVPFVVHGILSVFAILPSIFLLRESAPTMTAKRADHEDSQLTTRAVLTLMWDRRFRGFFCAQLFASMTRGVLWGGTMLLYATFAYDIGPRGLGGLATMSTIVGIPITLCCGYLMDRFGRKTTMVPGFALMAFGLFFSRCRCGVALGFCLLHWRVSLGALRPGGHCRQHAGAGIRHGAGQRSRTLLWLLAFDRRNRRPGEPGAVRLCRRSCILRGRLQHDRPICLGDGIVVDLLGQRDGRQREALKGPRIED